MTKLEREVRRRERERLRQVNMDGFHVFKVAMQILMVALAIIIGITIWFLAAAKQAQEVQAAVLRHHRITASSLVDIPVVEPLPLTPPEDGEPPQAIEVKMASQAEAVPEERWESLGTFKISHYCACRTCSGKWGHQTSSGATCQEGVTVAVDPRYFPEGAVIRIDGYGERIVQDTGGGIRGRHIDVFYESHQECLDRGIAYREVFVRR